MPSNTKEALSVLQKEFAEKLKTYQKLQSPSVSKIQLNLETIEKYNLAAEDYVQLGPFSCREILDQMGVIPEQLKKNKALVLGFLADTFTARGFNVNVYNIAPETGEVSVQKIEPVPEAQRPELQLSAWDKFWGLFGYETSNARAIKGLKEAKAKEAEVSLKMKSGIAKKSAELKAVANIVPKDLSSYEPEATEIFNHIEKGEYKPAVDKATKYLQNYVRKNAAATIKEQIIDNKEIKGKKDPASIKALEDKAVVVFLRKFRDENFIYKDDMEKALAFANILSDPAKTEEVCKCTLQQKPVKKLVEIPHKSGRVEVIEKETISTDFTASKATLAEYIPTLEAEVYDFANSEFENSKFEIPEPEADDMEL